MLLAIIQMAAVAAGGLGLTYLIQTEKPLLWRVCAGAVIGSAVFGMAGFLLAMAAGLNAATVAGAFGVTLLPLILVFRGPGKRAFSRDWSSAKGRLQGASQPRVLGFIYYAAFLVLFLLFFSQTMYEMPDGIYTGGSNNLGDLPYHLGAILSFTEANNFPPVNPSFAGAKFSYPFISDLMTACFMKLGAPLREAMFVQNVAWAFSLLVILESFVFRLVRDRFAARLAPALLFFSGGLGFLWFLGDFSSQAKGFFEFLGSIGKDYTIGPEFRWGNSMITLFMTQRSLLLGMPLTLVVLGVLWRVFSGAGNGGASGDKSPVATAPGSDGKPATLAMFVAGLLAGLLPLVHLHSLAVLFVVVAVLFFLRLDLWKEWLIFGAGVCVVAVPQLIWSISGSATETTKFFDWHFGWDSGKSNVLWFWIKNTGLLFPLLALGIYLFCFPQSRKDAKEEGAKGDTTAMKPLTLLLFYIPFAALFIIANIAKLAPWEWDNIKVLIYWFVGSLPFVAYAVSWMWRRAAGLKIAAAACIMILTASGALDVWRTISGQNKIRVFDADAVTMAGRVRTSTPANALFLNAPTYNSAVVLTGRQSLMRYAGHLASHGIDYAARERDVKAIYAGGPQAEELINKYGIHYVLISPEERNTMSANQGFFGRYPVAVESGQYKVYKVR
jgi:hypothetical protein